MLAPTGGSLVRIARPAVLSFHTEAMPRTEMNREARERAIVSEEQRGSIGERRNERENHSERDHSERVAQ